MFDINGNRIVANYNNSKEEEEREEKNNVATSLKNNIITDSNPAIHTESSVPDKDPLPIINEDKKTILVAEDVDSNYMLLYILLKNKYNVIHAKNGFEAIEIAQANKIDLIFMDLKMPKMGGIEATKEIRTFNTSIPIVALTAYAFEGDKNDAYAAGCNGFITKPVNKETLMECVHKYFCD